MTVRREIVESHSVAPIAPGEQWVPGVEQRTTEAYFNSTLRD
ncbi:MAG: hypothetical protein VST64_08155 [Nitrospirota bacterium]|nr:hypothetical protein [Nitrospirota bacterium]